MSPSFSGIQLRRATKRYGGRVVLREVELALRPARSVVVAGANGSGKSTLLRLIAGVARPSSGVVAGLPVRVGYLPERFGPPPLMRADTYLRHVGRIAGLSASSARARVDALLDRLEIAPSPRNRLGTLSKGNLQKVGLAQVFLSRHDLVVLDEPRTGLERSIWPVLEELILGQCQSGGLVVCSEHDPDVLAAATDRLTVEDGAVAVDDTGSRPSTGLPPFRIQSHVLRRGGGDLAALVAALAPANVEHTPDGELVLWVPGQEKDRALLWLLSNGWSVTRVEAGPSR